MTRGRDKREAILAAAADLFMRDGYNASLDAVAAQAGVSKQTVYNHFGNKEALFQAIVSGITDELTLSLNNLSPGRAPTEVLLQLARQVLRLALMPAMLDLHRTVIGEAQRFPELARQTYMAGPQGVVDRLAAYLAAESRQGRLRVGNPTLAAEQFLGMVVGHFQLRALLGIEDRPDPGLIEENVRTSVEIFLRAHTPALA